MNVARRSARGFTLLEMMLVVLLIGILAGVAMVSFAGRLQAGRIEATKMSLRSIKGALVQYSGTYASFPPDLSALVTGSSPFLDKIPNDAWKTPFLYYPVGSSGDPNRPFDLISAGPDKTAGTPDDIDVWTMDDSPHQ